MALWLFESSQLLNDALLRFVRFTLPKTNIAPENRPRGKGDSYWKPPFLGAMLVSGRVFPTQIRPVACHGGRRRMLRTLERLDCYSYWFWRC